MRFDRAIAAAVFLSAIVVAAGANAFETTSIGGTNPDGSAKYQDPDETGGVPMPSSSSPFGNFNFQVGTTNDSDASTNWMSRPGGPGTGSGFGFSGSQSSSSSEPASPFNTPILRERN